MPMGSEADAQRLRRALRDLVALSTVPAAWVGREPPAIAAGLADVLVNALHLDFAFVRLCDPNGGAAVEIARGSAWPAFPEWLQYHLAVNGRLSHREIVRDIGNGAQRYCGIVIPVGVNAEGGLVAAACNTPTFLPKLTSCCSPWPRIMGQQHFGQLASSTITAAPRKRYA